MLLKTFINILFVTLIFPYSLFSQSVISQLIIEDLKVERGLIGSDSISLRVTAIGEDEKPDMQVNSTLPIKINGEDGQFNFKNGQAILKVPKDAPRLLFLQYQGTASTHKFLYLDEQDSVVKVKVIPLWFSMLPPLVAIVLALILREVIISLFAGIWIGAFIANGFTLRNFFESLMNVIDKYVLNAMMDSGHLSVIIFSLLIGGMVAIISQNGGMQGVVEILSKYAKTARSTQLVTWLLGVLIFFDDYANTLIVGHTMRPVTDKYRVSREKLAYIVDSTAAPVAAIAFITTWIGAELGYINDAMKNLSIESSAYSMFMQSLKYAYYPIFTLIFMLIIIYLKKDFASMYTAEVRSRLNPGYDGITATEGNHIEMDMKKGLQPRWFNAFIPVVSVVLITILGLVITGYDQSIWQDTSTGFIHKLSTTIGNSDSYAALLWASLSGVIIALLLSWSQRLLKADESIETMTTGFKMILPAVLILVSAWSLAIITQELHTAEFLTGILLGKFHPGLLPALTFTLASLISFSTGSSWSTMAILYPIILPTTWTLCQTTGLETEHSMTIMHNVIAVVLAGSVLGDHCSPISDTTILSSLASNCNHIDHVRTQLPYALVVGLTSLLTGGLLFYIGIPWWLNYLIGIGFMIAVVNTFGKKLPE